MHALQLTLQARNGALTRVLGLVERRGFTPIRVGVETTDHGTLELAMDVVSQRPVQLLVRQLTRLLEVETVEVLQ